MCHHNNGGELCLNYKFKQIINRYNVFSNTTKYLQQKLLSV